VPTYLDWMLKWIRNWDSDCQRTSWHTPYSASSPHSWTSLSGGGLRRALYDNEPPGADELPSPIYRSSNLAMFCEWNPSRSGLRARCQGLVVSL
jgi:hypothetical protein